MENNKKLGWKAAPIQNKITFIAFAIVLLSGVFYFNT